MKGGYKILGLGLPDDESRHARKGDQRVVHGARGLGNGQERDTGDQVREQQRDPRHTRFVHATHESRRLAVPSHEEDRSRGHVHGRIPGADDGNDDDGIDQACPSTQPSVTQRNREWTLRRFGFLGQQPAVVVRDQDTDEKHRADVKNQDTPEDLANGPWYSFGWIVCLTGCDANHFGAGVQSTSYNECVGHAVDGVGESASCKILK